eukprot:gene2011-2356_t
MPSAERLKGLQEMIDLGYFRGIVKQLDEIAANDPDSAARSMPLDPPGPSGLDRAINRSIAEVVLIVDDVMSAGTAVRESIAAIQAAGAVPHAVAIALDRQEKATENGVDVDHSAVQYVRNQLGLQVVAIATLDDLLSYLSGDAAADLGTHRERVLAYRTRYGAL